jgi:hypothetical protein
MRHCTTKSAFSSVSNGTMTSLVSIIIMRSAPPRGTGA